MKFGAFLRKMREKKKMRQEDLAKAISVSTVYVCDIEKGRRNPPDLQKLKVWENLLTLSSRDRAIFYDLAGSDRKEIPPDISDYLSAHPDAKDAIRRVMTGSCDYDWKSIRV